MSNILKMPLKKPFVIAIDGMAGAGKHTLGQALARKYDFSYLDTGLIYRAVAALVLAEGASISDPQACLAVCDRFTVADVQREGLRAESIGQAASVLGSYPEVREKLLKFQRSFVEYPSNSKGVILDGRDIGTVVCPDADVKLFLTVDLPTAADRRYKELQKLGIPSIYDTILHEMQARDQRDQRRATAPMRPAEDAYVIDTTRLSIEDVLTIAVEVIDRKLKGETGYNSQIL